MESLEQISGQLLDLSSDMRVMVVFVLGLWVLLMLVYAITNTRKTRKLTQSPSDRLRKRVYSHHSRRKAG